MGVLDQVSHIALYAAGRFLSLSCWAMCVMKGSHTGLKVSSSVCPHVSFSLLVSFSSRAVSHTTWYHWSMFIPDRSFQCLVMMFLVAESRWIMRSLCC